MDLPSGSGVRVHSTRLVSLTQRSIAAIAYEVEALDAEVRVVIQSELVANEQLPERGGDPRVSAALESPLEAEENAAVDKRLLLHRTEASKLRVGAADGPPDQRTAAHPPRQRAATTSPASP
jgi:alpha,alpha-trehalose phosphorylase